MWGKFKETGTATTGVDTVKEEIFDKERVMHWRANVNQAVKSTRGLKEWLKETVAHVKISKLDWSTDFSLGDAADTATASGAVWGLKWSIVGFISQWVKLQQHPRILLSLFLKMSFVLQWSLSVRGKCQSAILCMP